MRIKIPSDLIDGFKKFLHDKGMELHTTSTTLRCMLDDRLLCAEECAGRSDWDVWYYNEKILRELIDSFMLFAHFGEEELTEAMKFIPTEEMEEA